MWKRFTEEDQQTIWDMREAGVPVKRIAKHLDRQNVSLRKFGALRRELHSYLRTGLAMRRAKGGTGQGQITNMVMISERPAEVADRAVPGHWEGDLIFGRKMTAIGTLVERHSRYVILLNLPNGHGAEAVRRAMTKRILTLPAQLRKSITWDQGKEMAQHVQFTVDTGVQIYFCDPKSPGQRGSNENTNGLLRQYLPKSADLSHPARARCHCSVAQHATSTDARMDDTINGVRRSCCDNHLGPQDIYDIASTSPTLPTPVVAPTGIGSGHGKVERAKLAEGTGLAITVHRSTRLPRVPRGVDLHHHCAIRRGVRPQRSNLLGSGVMSNHKIPRKLSAFVEHLPCHADRSAHRLRCAFAVLLCRQPCLEPSVE